MAKLILNDTVKRYGKIAIAKTKTIKVELDGKKIEIPPSCSLTLDTNLGEHTLRTYASILSKGPVKKINIGEEGAEIDIIFNSKEVIKTSIIAGIIVAFGYYMCLYFLYKIFWESTKVLFYIYEFGVLAIAYAILQKKGAFIIKIKNNSEKTDENLKTLKNSE